MFAVKYFFGFFNALLSVVLLGINMANFRFGDAQRERKVCIDSKGKISADKELLA